MNIYKITKLLLGNFFLIVLIIRFAALLGFSFNFMRVYQVLCLGMGVICMFKIKYNTFDRLVILYLAYIFMNAFMITYDHHSLMVYYAFLAQIIPVLFYFIGRYVTSLSMEDVLKRMKWPILFAVVCGLLFFVQPPAWYMQMKMDQAHSGTTDFSMLGILRLSSFWGHPYQIGYATLLFLAYIMYDYINNEAVGRNKLSQYGIISLCVICLLLAQLRVTIAVALLMLFYFIFMLKKESVGGLFKTTLIAVVLVSGVVYYVMSSGSETSNYIAEHMTMMFNQDDYTDRFEHTAGGITDYSLFGNGFGRYGFMARETGGWALVDHEFQRHLAELGYIGMGILTILLILTGKQCIMKKELTLETGVFLFFVIAMLGASILSNEHQYNFIFWFCIGKIWNSKYKSIERVIEAYG